MSSCEASILPENRRFRKGGRSLEHDGVVTEQHSQLTDRPASTNVASLALISFVAFVAAMRQKYCVRGCSASSFVPTSWSPKPESGEAPGIWVTLLAKVASVEYSKV